MRAAAQELCAEASRSPAKRASSAAGTSLLPPQRIPTALLPIRWPLPDGRCPAGWPASSVRPDERLAFFFKRSLLTTFDSSLPLLVAPHVGAHVTGLSWSSGGKIRATSQDAGNFQVRSGSRGCWALPQAMLSLPSVTPPVPTRPVRRVRTDRCQCGYEKGPGLRFRSWHWQHWRPASRARFPQRSVRLHRVRSCGLRAQRIPARRLRLCARQLRSGASG